MREFDYNSEEPERKECKYCEGTTCKIVDRSCSSINPHYNHWNPSYNCPVLLTIHLIKSGLDGKLELKE
ncbi:MAG: hypothetical protein WCI72_02740 [archaeon]